MKIGDMNMPGPGDEKTWPACTNDPMDPRTPEDDTTSVDEAIDVLMQDCLDPTKLAQLMYDWEPLAARLDYIIVRIAEADVMASKFYPERKDRLAALGYEMVKALREALTPAAVSMVEKELRRMFEESD